MNPHRLHHARKAKGLTTRALGEATGVSAMAISKYERGVTRPSEAVLGKLLAELDIDRDFLEKTDDIHLEDVEYRTLHELGLSQGQEKRILADVTAQLEVRLECERLIPGLWPGEPKLPRLPKTIDNYDDIEAVAEAVRAAWQLADLPIKNLLQTVEQHGFRVFSTEVDKGDKFDGFSAVHDDMPIIVLGTGWSGDRQRFTLAHELGHHLMKGRFADKLDDETACHRFASALLVPKARVIATLGWHRKSITPYELYILKHEWGLSMQAWVHRARQAGVISERAAKAQWTIFRRNKWFRQEPLEQYPIEQPFRQYTAIAQELQKGRIDPGMAAKLMKVPREHLVGLLNLGG